MSGVGHSCDCVTFVVGLAVDGVCSVREGEQTLSLCESSEEEAGREFVCFEERVSSFASSLDSTRDFSATILVVVVVVVFVVFVSSSHLAALSSNSSITSSSNNPFTSPRQFNKSVR